MICTYQEYLSQEKALTFEQMQQLHKEMLEEIGTDLEAANIYDELIEAANRYAGLRARWLLMNRDEKNEKDSVRTSSHDYVIMHFNMLARYLKTQGKAAAWRETLGDAQADPYIRKAIGDFACYLVFVNSLNAR